MKKLVIPILIALFSLTLSVVNAAPPLPEDDGPVAGYGHLPLHFEPNRGQTDASVRYLARGEGYTMFMTPAGITLVLRQEAEAASTSVVQMLPVGANPNPRLIGLDELPGRSHYLIGNDPSAWQTDVPNFRRVKYQQVWPGIDLVLYGYQGQLEYDFVVAPGADPARIGLAFAGVEHLELDVAGALLLHLPGDGQILRQSAPVIYQERDGLRQEVEGGFVLVDEQQVGFELGAYDPTLPLTIDPHVDYSTYLGGSHSSGDWPYHITVDVGGNAYVTGYTQSTDFPTTAGTYDPTLNGGSDIFVTRLDPAGSGLIYSTFIGGSNADTGHFITVDANGYAYVTGQTRSTDFPATPGAYDTSRNGINGDAFLLKLNPAGSDLIYATYFGSGGIEYGRGVAVDTGGNAYLMGSSHSLSDIPTTAGAYDTSRDGNLYEVFVTRFNATGSALIYSTYVGGYGSDTGYDLALDSAGNVYVTGQTDGADFPTTPGAYDRTFNGGSTDVFVFKLNATGSALVYSTYIGGSGPDRVRGLAVDAGGQAYLAGWLEGYSSYPTTAGAFDTGFNSDWEGFVTKLNSSGSGLIYSTYLGNGGTNTATDIALDSTGNAYVVGMTSAAGFPTTAGAFDTGFNGYSDAYALKLDAGGSTVLYSTFLGGSYEDQANGVAVDRSGKVYVTGPTRSPNFPTTPAAYDPDYNGVWDQDAFVVKLNMSNNAPTLSDIPDQNTDESTPTGPISFTIGDLETPAGDLSLNGYSTNPDLVPETNITFGGSGTNRTVNISPLPGQVGTTTLTVTVDDGTDTTADTFELLVNDTTAPTNPTGATETGGAVDDTWQNIVSDPAFTWPEATDQGGVAGYYVYFGPETGGTATTYTTTAAYDPPGVPSGTYYLRVQSRDTSGNLAPWTTLFTFKYDDDPPVNPAFTEPGSTSGQWTNEAGPDFACSGATDTDSGVDGYNIYFGPSPNGTDSTFLTSCEYEPPALSSSGSYYLRVRTRDRVGNWSGWSTAYTYQYDGDAPINPTFTDTGSSSGQQTSDNDPGFSCSGAADADSGVDGYNIYFGPSPAGTDSSFLVSCENDPRAVSTGTHYLRARTRDNAGNWSAWETGYVYLYDGQADPDGDGLTNDEEHAHHTDPEAADTDGDTIPDGWEVANGLDPLTDDAGADADDDGLTNLQEYQANTDPQESDTDQDTIPDGVEGTGDTDGDGTIDALDPDDDGDGIDTGLECAAGPLCPDTDGDGTFDHLDLDADGDGIEDADEGAGDTDGDGRPDFQDTDADGDGLLDIDEGVGDQDGDGTANYLDLDSDGDGIEDAGEGGGDTDGDGTPDYLDLDADGDGIGDVGEGAGDTDGDGTPDFQDTDADGDGILDTTECPAGLVCPDTDRDDRPDFQDADADGDGISDAKEGTADADGDGRPDFQDTDADGDGLLDANEGAGDTDGDGTPDYLDDDADGDGLLDRYECPFGLICTDTDGDGIPDFQDTDADGDGIPDADEGTTDADGDGLPDHLDPDNGDGGHSDSDGDGLSDSSECPNGPPCPDSDGDDIPDYEDPTDELIPRLFISILEDESSLVIQGTLPVTGLIAIQDGYANRALVTGETLTYAISVTNTWPVSTTVGLTVTFASGFETSPGGGDDSFVVQLTPTGEPGSGYTTGVGDRVTVTGPATATTRFELWTDYGLEWTLNRHVPVSADSDDPHSIYLPLIFK